MYTSLTDPSKENPSLDDVENTYDILQSGTTPAKIDVTTHKTEIDFTQIDVEKYLN
ncbi:MAG: hypothetical protein WCL18_08630 [bacterium]